jgi:hypothetical protein
MASAAGFKALIIANNDADDTLPVMAPLPADHQLASRSIDLASTLTSSAVRQHVRALHDARHNAALPTSLVNTRLCLFRGRHADTHRTYSFVVVVVFGVLKCKSNDIVCLRICWRDSRCSTTTTT